MRPRSWLVRWKPPACLAGGDPLVEPPAGRRAFGSAMPPWPVVWRRYGLQPWRRESFKFSTDPALEAKVRDVVGLYLDPPQKAVVLCVDEKSQIQALDRTAPMLPLRPGFAGESHARLRAITAPPPCSLALEVATGHVTEACYELQPHEEVPPFLKKVARAYPRRELHVVVGQLRDP